MPAKHSLGLQAVTSSPAADFTRAVGELGAVSRPYLARLPLDHTGLPGCSDACVEESLKVRKITCPVWSGMLGSQSPEQWLLDQVSPFGPALPAL